MKRQYKKIDAWRVLSKAEHGFKLKASQEKFVKLLDYKETWASSYGRVIIKDENGMYQLLEGKYTGAILYYTLDQNVYFKSKKEWGYRRQKVSASELVIQTFIVNHDMKNNTIPHIGEVKSKSFLFDENRNKKVLFDFRF